MKTLPLIITAAIISATSLMAQVPGGGPAGMNSAISKLFGANTNFSALANVRVSDAKSKKETMSMPMNFSMLNGKVRTEIDMTQMKSDQLPPGAAASMKQMGMDKVVSIIVPEKKSMLLIYPNLKSVITMPMEKGEAAALEKEPKIVKTPVGKETIDGHATVKNKVAITNADGKTQEMFTWNAADLKDFPVQIQMVEGDTAVLMSYKNVSFAKPDAKLFEAPADFKQYTDMQKLMQDIMQKMVGSQGAPAPAKK